MAVRAARIVIGTLVIPVADHTRSKHQEREQREGNTENAKRLLHRSIIRKKQDLKLLHSNWMLDVRKALHVALSCINTSCHGRARLGRLLQSPFYIGQAALGALTQDIVPMACILLT